MRGVVIRFVVRKTKLLSAFLTSSCSSSVAAASVGGATAAAAAVSGGACIWCGERGEAREEDLYFVPFFSFFLSFY